MRSHSIGLIGALCAMASVSSASAAVFNDPPVAVNDTYSMPCESIRIFDVLSNDYDPNNDSLTLVSAETGDLGSYAEVRGNAVEFSAIYSGTQTFYYTVQDSSGAYAYGTATVNVSYQRACEA